MFTNFNCNDQWYTQIDGVAMGSQLAVIVANIWMKQFKLRLSREITAEWKSVRSKQRQKLWDVRRATKKSMTTTRSSVATEIFGST